jgi:hypothetical protein
MRSTAMAVASPPPIQRAATPRVPPVRASALNSVCPVPNLSIPFKIGSAATALFGCLVTRGAPAYASGDVSVRLYIDQD